MVDTTDIPHPFIRCYHCRRHIPIENGKLIRHYVAGRFFQRLEQLLHGGRLAICRGSLTNADVHVEELKLERDIY